MGDYHLPIAIFNAFYLNMDYIFNGAKLFQTVFKFSWQNVLKLEVERSKETCKLVERMNVNPSGKTYRLGQILFYIFP